MEIWMKFKKSTKNKHVFEQCDEMGEAMDYDLAAIQSLYISKNSIDGPAKFITITLNLGMQVNTDE